MDFSPYGKDDISEIGTTNRVYIPAEYGAAYTIVFAGNEADGFTAHAGRVKFRARRRKLARPLFLLSRGFSSAPASSLVLRDIGY